MAIDKYLNVGKSRHRANVPCRYRNACRQSALIIEADRTLSVCTNGKEQPLGISPPREANGDDFCIKVENIPPTGIAEIRRIGGKKIRHGDKLSTDELANLAYVSKHNAIPDAPPVFAYSVTSKSGDHARQTLRFLLVQSSPTGFFLASDHL